MQALGKSLNKDENQTNEFPEHIKSELGLFIKEMGTYFLTKAPV